jgi:hypothetical protein
MSVLKAFGVIAWVVIIVFSIKDGNTPLWLSVVAYSYIALDTLIDLIDESLGGGTLNETTRRTY